MPKVYVKTYGCQMNERDSEQVVRTSRNGVSDIRRNYPDIEHGHSDMR